MLDNIRIVLISTSHTGNMGSAARAMKTMGLSELYLVNPESEPDGKATALAAGASDIVHSAKIVGSLDEAINDCGLVIGASARSRTHSWPMLEPRECGEKVFVESQKHPVALVFGRESSGLTNEELQQCNFHVHIPANPDYSALNLAMAVQVLCYEVRMAMLASAQAPQKQASELEYPLANEMEGFYQHLEQALKDTGFIVPQHPGTVLTKLRRLFNRARPEAQELNMLRGVLSSVQKAARK
ncbi:tRNA (cytosine(32)/uridine(32)-2'-O)-methyltransferase TrmJ [Corallincola luteus]|uniref:tRNA (cytidine/uridine-2'-O-)-methyltransferase TrmJ n=2 Tax=Corallincola TaxID=1775176 RepID=A0A368NHB6_9GAMM|nr:MULTISPECIES: tRNA (cytosine(32)/uridine(32)-2'-O)-methyltransferase TrmJ [Corallincola]RCU48781.1 tRNA (cytosine(32)/uridine(32)-2'-O)-methyltransferase TrmJ [Corallincola holothuriorum]TCI01671.1 tRNA (cytosine(32)/uridine(32)-2'-O)-methyltransferase TrmJ [Corallincola luteus]